MAELQARLTLTLILTLTLTLTPTLALTPTLTLTPALTNPNGAAGAARRAYRHRRAAVRPAAARPCLQPAAARWCMDAVAGQRGGQRLPTLTNEPCVLYSFS